ncbi:MAG: hypothetical protein F7C81_00470 [Desulfurococcales archaeon]|nr:hypothetical protein [Desulfurococcales archaeon]
MAQAPAARVYAYALVVIYTALIMLINPLDYEVFERWVIVASHGVLEMYRSWTLLGMDFRIVYPPLSPLMFMLSYKMAAILDRLPDCCERLRLIAERLVVKIPVFLAVILHAKTAERLYEDKKYYYAILAGAPTMLVVAAYDFEPFMTLLALLSLVAFHRRRYVLAGMLLALSSMFKLATGVILVYYVVLLITLRKLRDAVVIVASYAAMALAVLAPFIYGSGLNSITYSILLYHSDRPPQGPTPLRLMAGNVEAYIALVIYAAILVTASLALSRIVDHESLDDHLLAAAALLVVFTGLSKVVNPVYTYWFYTMAAPAMLSRGRWLKFYAITALILLIIGAWYSIPATASIVLDKPYYDEETSKTIPPWRMKSMVNETFILVDVNDTLATTSPQLEQALGEVTEHITVVRYSLLAGYTITITALATLILLSLMRK